MEETHSSIQANHQTIKMFQSKIFMTRNEKQCTRINEKMQKLRETTVGKSENPTTDVYYRQYIEEPVTYQLNQKLHSCCDTEHRSHNNSRCLLNDFNSYLRHITRNPHRQRNKLFSSIRNQSFIRFRSSYILWEVKCFITVKFWMVQSQNW